MYQPIAHLPPPFLLTHLPIARTTPTPRPHHAHVTPRHATLVLTVSNQLRDGCNTFVVVVAYILTALFLIVAVVIIALVVYVASIYCHDRTYVYCVL